MKLETILKACKKHGIRRKNAIAITSGLLEVKGLEFDLKIAVNQDDRLQCEFDQVEQLLLVIDQINVVDAGVDNFDTDVSVYAKTFVDNLLWCSIACGYESTRYALGGVLLTGSEIVACDGQRMHYQDCKLGVTVLNCIIPVGAIQFLKTMLVASKEKTIKIQFGANTIVFIGSNWMLSHRLIEGRFPNWKMVVPDIKNHDRLEMTQASLDECKAITKRVKLENAVALSKLDKAGKKAFCEDTPSMHIGGSLLDCRYVADALEGSKIPTTIATCGKGNCPSMLYRNGNEGFAVIMPMNRKGK